VPLVGENRILVARGLLAIPVSTSPGLAALCAVSGARADGFGAEDVAFKLAPRLNAAGRLGEAETALSLLTAADSAEAARLAQQLDTLNEQRRSLDRSIHEAAAARVAALPPDEPILLHDDAWATGLLGLVAGRLASSHGRPAVLISALQGQPAKGSMRSVAGYSAHEALAACAAHLVGHGGHAMAAGFQIESRSIPGFRRALSEHWHGQRSAGPPPALEYDGELPLAAVTPRLVEQLQRLAPFGQGNARPVLGLLGAKVLGAQRMGDGSHLSLQLGQGPAQLRAVAFGRGELAPALPPGTLLDLLVTPRINRFRGRQSVELEVSDLRATTAAPFAARANGSDSTPGPSTAQETG